MIKRLLSAGLVATILTLTLAGCDDTKGRALFSGPVELPPASMLKTPFKDPTTPVLYELPSQALATWREYAKYRPALVLFSNQPLLDLIPSVRKKEVHQLLLKGSVPEIVNRAQTLTNDPAILPTEAISAAIDNGLISELVLVLPSQKKAEEIDLENFRQRALANGFLTDAEAGGLTLLNGVISGAARGLPIRIVHPDHLPKIEKPTLLHIDLAFFKGMYINEIKTPSYELLHQLATNVSAANYATIGTTLSFSNQEGGIALESRFLIRDLAAVLRKPELLTGATPASWALRSSALYHATMFAQDKARDLNFQAAKESPEDAAALHRLALDLFEQGLSNQGFTALDQAVELDPGYGLEYLYLAEQGFKMGKKQKSIELIAKAAKTFPSNPFIRQEMSNQLIQSGRVKEARPLITELRALTWSKEFYPEVPKLLEEMADAAAIDSLLPPTPDPISSPTESAPQMPAGEKMPKFNHMGMPGR